MSPRRGRRPPEAGNRAHIPRAIASREAMHWQGCSFSASLLSRETPRSVLGGFAARVAPDLAELSAQGAKHTSAAKRSHRRPRPAPDGGTHNQGLIGDSSRDIPHRAREWKSSFLSRLKCDCEPRKSAFLSPPPLNRQSITSQPPPPLSLSLSVSLALSLAFNLALSTHDQTLRR